MWAATVRDTTVRLPDGVLVPAPDRILLVRGRAARRRPIGRRHRARVPGLGRDRAAVGGRAPARARSAPARPRGRSQPVLGRTSLDSLLALGERVYLRGAYDTAARALDRSARSARRAAHDSLAEARALTWLGLAAWRQGDYRAARRLGEEALALKRRLARPGRLFKSYNALGLLAWNEGRLARCHPAVREASAAARAAGDAKGIASASGNLALVQTELGEFEEARRGFDSMRVAGRALGDARIEGNALTNLGMLAVRVGDPAARHPPARLGAGPLPRGGLSHRRAERAGPARYRVCRARAAAPGARRARQRARSCPGARGSGRTRRATSRRWPSCTAMRATCSARSSCTPAPSRSTESSGLTVEAGADLRSQAEIQGELGAMERAWPRAAGARQPSGCRLAVRGADRSAAAGGPRGGGPSGGARTSASLGRADARATRLGVRRARRAGGPGGGADRGPELGRRARARGRSRARRAISRTAGTAWSRRRSRSRPVRSPRLGRLDSAAAVGRRAMAALERVRGGYGSGELRTSYLAGKQGAYADLAEVLRRLGRTEEAFEVADAARGRALVEGLATRERESGMSGACRAARWRGGRRAASHDRGADGAG